MADPAGACREGMSKEAQCSGRYWGGGGVDCSLSGEKLRSLTGIRARKKESDTTEARQRKGKNWVSFVKNGPQ